MNTLFTAIYNKVIEETPSHNAFYTSIGGRFYDAVAPQQISGPYCTFHLINDAETSTLTELMDTFIIQFSIFAENSNENSTDGSKVVGTIYENLKTLFDDTFLTVTGYTNFGMRRQFSRRSYIPEENIWQYVVEYAIITKKN